MGTAASKPVMTVEQCNTVYVDMLAAHFRLRDQLPYDEQRKQHDRLVGMLSAIRVIRGDDLDEGLMVDIVEADIRAHGRGQAPALNVKWL